MSVLLVSPSGKRDPEVGLLYLIGRFLIGQGHHVSQLLCNGVISNCDRDSDSNWRRGVGSCMQCMQEQRELAHWSGLGSQRLSEGIPPELVQQSFRQINSCDPSELLGLSWQGVRLAELVQDTFAQRFGVGVPDLNNKQHERFLRALMVAAARVYHGAAHLLQHNPPEIILLPAAAGLITTTITKVARDLNLPACSLQSNLSKRCTVVRAELTGAQHECPLVIEDVVALRTDIKTWSPDLLAILRSAEEFLGLTTQSAAVPVRS